MNIYTHTGLGRHIDVRLPSNLFAVLGSALAGAVAFVVPWITDGEFDVFGAAAVAVAVFVAWAIARELDPDNNASAAVALVLAGMGAFLGPQAPGAAALVLLAARVAAGTVGRSLRPADLIVLVLAAAYAGTRPEAWAAGLMLAGAVATETGRSHRPVAAAMLVAGFAGALVSGAMPDVGRLDGPAILLLIATGLSTVAIVRVGEVRSMSDGGEHPIDASRVVAARIGSGVSAVVGGVLFSSGGAVALVPVTAALIGVAVTGMRSRPLDHSSANHAARAAP